VDRSNPAYPVTFMHSPQGAVPIQLQLAMSVPDALGSLSYDAQTDAVRIAWNADEQTPSGISRQASFDRLAVQSGGVPIPFISGTIWHPLGGAVFNDACDELGQLYGYRNLFVMDGSLFPGSAATVNPALTIAANAERIMDTLAPTLL
jgi:cholesterol oxidase